MSPASRNVAEERRAMYKSPPAVLRDASTSQDARRKKALEEQKRRRAERFDSSRQLDFLADLTLGPSDDEDEDGDVGPVREGVAQFASLLPSVSVGPSTAETATLSPQDTQSVNSIPISFTNNKKKGKGKRKAKSRGGAKAQSSKPSSKWADKCMYAELLELVEDTGMGDFDGSESSDGVPLDIETAWVAVAPVPTGKRCLAITHAPSGIAGLVPNTTLRSRVLGKSLMKSFPSNIPPHTILDCILDENWRHNGILHVLDIIKWKGQDIADCETPFRFWWRDTRLSELSSSPPPTSDPEPTSSQYRFSYPTTLLPIPYHTDLSLPHLSNTLIPLSRSSRSVPISVPVYISSLTADSASHMDAEAADLSTKIELKTEEAQVKSDGMLLYVAQATYEPGTSPLSLWIPVRSYTEDRLSSSYDVPAQKCQGSSVEGPLDVFERLINKRRSQVLSTPDVAMEV